MTMKRFQPFVIPLLTLSLYCGDAHAGDTNLELQPTSKGWLVVALSTAVGIAVTTAALSVGCPHDEQTSSDCSRYTSAGIWGGFGIASIGSVIGILIVEKDVKEARRRLAQRASVSRTMLTWTF
jgi:hypothetical protein